MAFIGKRLRRMRELKDLTQEQLGNLICEEVGYRKSTISGWERGSSSPNAASIKKLCLVLGTSADYLLGLSDENTPNINNRELPEEIGNLKLKETAFGRNSNFEQMSLQDLLDLITMTVMHFYIKEND